MKLMILLMLINSCYVSAQENLDNTPDTGIVKTQETVEEIPDGSRCYTDTALEDLDSALDAGLKCQINLNGCRGWRDKYRDQCSVEIPDFQEPIYIYPTPKEPRDPKWVKYALTGVLAFGLGIGIGASL